MSTTSPSLTSSLLDLFPKSSLDIHPSLTLPKVLAVACALDNIFYQICISSTKTLPPASSSSPSTDWISKHFAVVFNPRINSQTLQRNTVGFLLCFGHSRQLKFMPLLNLKIRQRKLDRAIVLASMTYYWHHFESSKIKHSGRSKAWLILRSRSRKNSCIKWVAYFAWKGWLRVTAFVDYVRPSVFDPLTSMPHKLKNSLWLKVLACGRRKETLQAVSRPGMTNFHIFSIS